MIEEKSKGIPSRIQYKTLVFGIMFGLLIAGGVVAFTTQVTPDTTEEVEEYELELPVLLDGEVIEDYLSGYVQTQLYVFNASAGDKVTISMTQLDEELDPFLVLLGPAGEVVASDDDSGNDVNLSALIENVELPSSGMYFIVASSFEYIDTILEAETDGKLDYRLSVSGISDEEDDEQSFVYYAGDLVDGEYLLGASSESEPVFYFTFVGFEGDVVDIEMSSDEFDTILHVFSPNGDRIAVNDDYYGTDSKIKGLELSVDGLYFVFATDVFFYSAGDKEEDLLVYEGGEFEIGLFSR